MSKGRIKLRIIHETNPQKYFPALFELDSDGVVDLVGTHRYSVCKEWFRAWLKDKTPLGVRTRNALNDLLLRFKLPFIRNETIVIGFAPWDWRLLIYRQLAKKNKILYQTSWHDWRLEYTPRQPKPYWLKKYLQSQWHKFVNHKNVKVIAVTPVVAQTVTAETGANPLVITHSVPKEFYQAGKVRVENSSNQIRLLYVGEISEKKGINALLSIMKLIKSDKITLTVVGNGPLVSSVKKAFPRVAYLGPIYDRTELAKVMAEHDVLMLLSQKTPTWEELFGIVIVEAIAAGCAVIATDHIGPRGILGDKVNNGIVSEGDHAAIQSYLNSFTKNYDAISELKVRQDVAMKYSTQNVKRSWFKAIKDK